MLRRIMRIHIQNPIDDPLFLFSHEQWDSAAARAGDIGRGHEVTLGNTDDDFAAGMEDAEALVTEMGVMLRLFPCRAPRLRLIFVTSAGLERLAPFDWLPSNVTLLNNSGTHTEKAGEFGIMSVLMLANRVPGLVTNQRAGKWQKQWGTLVGGKHLTVVGLGGMGAPIARWGRLFGLQVTGVRTAAAPHPDCDEVITAAELDRVLPTDRLPGARLPADARDAGHDGSAPPRAAAARRGGGEHRPRRAARPGCAVRPAGQRAPVRRGAGRVHAGAAAGGAPDVDDAECDHLAAHLGG